MNTEFLKEAGLPNYNLSDDKPISSKFLSLGCKNLYDAINFVHKFPYARASKIESLNEFKINWHRDFIKKMN